MAENSRIRDAVEAVVAEAFDSHIRALHDDIVTRVMDRLQPLVASGKQASQSLKAAIEAIEAGVQQTEILTALLDNAASFARRTALFVLRGTTAVGWQARGFDDAEALRILSVDVTSGLAASALQQRHMATGRAASFDRRFAPGLGVPLDAECAIMPLIIRDRVAAILYAEGACDGNTGPDVSAIEILVKTAGQWIELQALRKASGTAIPQGRSAVQAPTTTAENPPVVASTQRSSEQPQASVVQTPPIGAHTAQQPHQGTGYKQQAGSTENTAMAATLRSTEDTPSNGAGGQYGTNLMKQTAGAATDELQPAPGHFAETDELHKKARRFAKLLVDEIVLYNKAKVIEGRSRRDLYDRLKDDIEKSRATYDKRYAETPVAGQDYFTQALINGLAEQNPDLLGPTFRHKTSATV